LDAGGVPPRRSSTPGPRAAAPAAEPRPEIWFRRRIGLVSAVRELWQFRGLILTLAERDLRVRYKQAALGIAWAIITPLAMMIAFTVFFTRVANFKAGTQGVPYALFSYLALLPWTFFSSSLTGGGNSLVGNVALLNKLYCPREVFPIATILDALADALIATLVLLLLFPIEGFAPKITSLYVPLLLLVLLVFTLGVTLAVTALVVYMRDLRLALPLVVQFGLFVSPVVYSSSTLVKSHTGLIIYSIVNPIVPVLDGLRSTVLLGHAPDWASLGAGAGMSLIVLFAGYRLFKRLETGIADVA
jgi:ABC-2 type transport system permease protein/lipopolysaccharide transport system permease protein